MFGIVTAKFFVHSLLHFLKISPLIYFLHDKEKKKKERKKKNQLHSHRFSNGNSCNGKTTLHS